MSPYLRFAALALVVPALALGACGKRSSLTRDPEPQRKVPAAMPAQSTPNVATPEVRPAKPIVHNPFGRNPL